METISQRKEELRICFGVCVSSEGLRDVMLSEHTGLVPLCVVWRCLTPMLLGASGHNLKVHVACLWGVIDTSKNLAISCSDYISGDIKGHGGKEVHRTTTIFYLLQGKEGRKSRSNLLFPHSSKHKVPRYHSLNYRKRTNDYKIFTNRT